MQLDGDGDFSPWCDRRGYRTVWRCPVDLGEWWTIQPCKCCDCWSCYELVKGRRAMRGYHSYGGQGLTSLVFTVPRSWHPWITPALARELRSLVAAVVIQTFRDFDSVEIGLCAAVHPEGDQEMGAWKPHVHAHLPPVGIRDGQVMNLHPSLRPPLLRALKAAWWRAMKRIAAEAGAPQPKGVNINARYQVGEAHVIHRISYDNRPFPDWAAGANAGFRQMLTPQRYGLLSPGKREESTPGLEEYRAKIKVQGEEYLKPCPDCRAKSLETGLKVVDRMACTALRFRSAILRGLTRHPDDDETFRGDLGEHPNRGSPEVRPRKPREGGPARDRGRPEG